MRSAALWGKIGAKEEMKHNYSVLQVQGETSHADISAALSGGENLLRLDEEFPDSDAAAGASSALFAQEEGAGLQNLRGKWTAQRCAADGSQYSDFARDHYADPGADVPASVVSLRGNYAPGNKGPPGCDLICDASICKEEWTRQYPNNLVGRAYYRRPVSINGLVEPYASGFFKGWHWSILFTVFAQCLQMWAAGLITKWMSGVYRAIGQAVAVCGLVFLMDLWLFRNPEKPMAVTTVCPSSVCMICLIPHSNLLVFHIQ